MGRLTGTSQKLTILIVEDEPLISMTVEDIVTDAGFDFESTANAADGIAALERSGIRFSVLITDINMPGKGNGWDVGRRAHDLHPLLPFIYMTSDSADQWKAFGEAGSKLLQKPFSDALLVTALTAFIA